ncbi:hypothetical protein INT45_013814, partial [Circinella minor]
WMREEAYDTTDPYVTNTVEPTIANEEYVDAWENEPPLCTNEPIAYTEYAPVPLDNHEKKASRYTAGYKKTTSAEIKDDDIHKYTFDITWYNNNRPHIPLLSPYKTESDLGKLFDLQEVKYRRCPKGCRLFPKGSSSPCKCEAPQFKPNGQPIKAMSYFSLAKQLSSFVAIKDTRDMLKETPQSVGQGVMTDIFHGSVYQGLKDDLFISNLDIAVSLYIDGFRTFNGGNANMMILHIVIMSLPANIRYKKEFMIQVATLPADHTGNLYTYLKPLLNELRILQDTGMKVACDDGEFSLKVHLMLASGDIIGVQELIHHKGHSSDYGCRQCRILSTSLISSAGKGHARYYPGTVAMSSPRPEFGIKKKTEFSELKPFHGYTFFGLDEMHLIGANYTSKIWSMISGEFPNVNSTFELDNTTCKAIGAAIAKSISNIPSSIFEGTFRDIFKKRGSMRSVDWIVFMQCVLPTLVFEQLAREYGPYAPQVEALMSYVIECCLALNGKSIKKTLSISKSNNEIDNNMYTINFHLLRHIHGIVKALGPLRAYSTRSAERSIGFFKKHVKSRVSPGENAGNVIKRQLLMRNFSCVYYGDNYLGEDPEKDEYTVPGYPHIEL